MRSPLKYERRGTAEASDFAFMARPDQRRTAGQGKVSRLLLDHRPKTMPRGGEVPCNQNRTGRNTGYNHPQSAANPLGLHGESLRGSRIAFLSPIEQFWKGDDRALWPQLPVIAQRGPDWN